MDTLIVASVLFSYVFFVFMHLVSFRFLKSEEILKSLMIMAIPTFVFHFVLLLFSFKSVQGSFGIVFVLSFLILVFLIFVHVLCLIGPYETSIRLRLIRELHRDSSRGMTIEEILKNYNARIILDKRLRRLLASRELTQEGDAYRINKHMNVFFFIDFVARILKKLTLSTKDRKCSDD